ncbi:MAG: Flp family type IVb pilin [Alphaproteobacteria bacterium]
MLKNVTTKISNFICIYAIAKLADDDGISAIEYALIAAAIALVVLTAAPDVGTGIDARMDTIEQAVQPAP